MAGPFRALLAAFLIQLLILPGALAADPATSPPPRSDQLGTPAAPVVVKVLPADEARSQYDMQRSAATETQRFDRWVIFIGLAQAFIFVCQFLAFAIQAKKLDETVQAAKAQSLDMQRSIVESARAASAMETVAEALTANTRTAAELLQLQRDVFQKQLRAYINVQLLGVAPENIDTGNRHEVRLDIVNAGNTPAHNIKVNGRLRVLPYPLPANPDLAFPLQPNESRGHIAPRDKFYVRFWLEGFLTPDENRRIKAHDGLGLYVFGTATYKDIFENVWHTDFCCLLTWDYAGNAGWVSMPNRNNAT